MIFKKCLAISFSMLSLSSFAWSSDEEMIWSNLEANFRAAGGDSKALSHAKCFFDKHENRTLKIHASASNARCGKVQNGKPEISINNKNVFTIIDYNQDSDEKRLFILNRQTGKVSAMAVAHGRYEAGYLNRILKDKHNTVKQARYFSNASGSNAPSSGFYITGGEYEGKFGRSMILHGLEKSVNDKACERAVVLHKHKLVSNNRASVMSSGCPMVSEGNLDGVVNQLKGKNAGGTMMFVYGPRERNWEYGECPSRAEILR